MDTLIDKNRRGGNNFRHGKYYSRSYKIYSGMLTRCNNKRSSGYKNYGLRGIRVLWSSFEEFYTDMGDAPSVFHSIDRIDSTKHYCKENCRWATSKEQANNRRNTIKFTINGITKTLMEWVELKNMNYMKVYQRIFRDNWTPNQALN